VIKYLKTDDERCVGCMGCVSACSRLYAKEDNPAKSRIQVNGMGKNSFHLIACDQECRKCVQECPTQALTLTKAGVVVLNKSLCVGCLACVAVCPIEAMRIFPGDKQPFKCIACGSCVKHCPKEAIQIAEKEDSPASRLWADAIAAVRKGAGE
jgi:anaerobic carbon-monoxide dehydrogenase iron sulfur subunit